LRLGYIIGGLSILQVFNPVKFAISFTLGNILSLTGYKIYHLDRTGFLIGFKKQCENMVDKERRITTIVFFSAMIMVFVSCYALHSKLLVLIFLIVEICAYIWYAASYIPFAQNCIKGCLNKTAKDIGVGNV
jgi:Got1/Sft2-like family